MNHLLSRRQWLATLPALIPLLRGDGSHPAPASDPGRNHPLDPRKSFSSFEVAPGNRAAFLGCQAISAGKPGTPTLLYVWGPPGTGKTHLLQATARAVSSARGPGSSWYATADEFRVDLVRAMHAGLLPDLRRRLRAAHLLLIDDVQTLQELERTTEEVVALVDWVRDGGGSVIIAGDAPPRDVTTSPRFADRLTRGLSLEIESSRKEVV